MPLVKALSRHQVRDELVRAAADLLLAEITSICDRALPQVIICAPPIELLELIGPPKGEGIELHDLVKARAMFAQVPLQYVRPGTYDPAKLARQRKISGLVGNQQDQATRAWNLHTALYYKAGGFPWALVRQPHALQTCYVGIAFYEGLQQTLLTSMAQVFNERGEGVIVRGGPARVTKDDRRPFLERDDAERLLREALARYRDEHHHLPARVVVHKTSRYTSGEIEGLGAAAEAEHVDALDLLALGSTATRFFTPRNRPPFGGTHIELDEQTHVLYTSGTVSFYEVLPRPLHPRAARGHDRPERVRVDRARERAARPDQAQLEPQQTGRPGPDHHPGRPGHRTHPPPRT